MTQTTKILDLIDRLRTAGAKFCIATVVRTANLTSAKAGAKAVVTEDGVIHGFVGGGCVTGAVRTAALEAIATGNPQTIRVRPKEEVTGMTDSDGAPLYKSMCPSGGTVEIFLEPTRNPRQLVICGASPVAEALITIARAVGFRVTVAAPAAERENAPGADGYIDDFKLEALGVQSDDAVVIATQGRRDRDALRGALASPARYVAMVGSRRKIAKLRSDLASEGAFPAARLADLRGPAGFDIGAVGPEEIALSIAAEMVAFLRQSAAASGSGAREAKS